MKKRLRAIIFDMDGVLIDSEPLHKEICQIFYTKLGIPFDHQYYNQFIGSTDRAMMQVLKKDYSLEMTIEELLEQHLWLRTAYIAEHPYPLIPHVRNLLMKLSKTNLSLAVASSSSKQRILEVLENHNLKQYFNFLVSGSEVENSKPAPDIFLYAAKKLNVSPEECLVIEDSNAGVQAAKAANICCVGFANKGSGDQNLHNADYIIEGFEEVDFALFDQIYCHSMGLPLNIGETDRLIIRELCLDDIPLLYTLSEKSGDHFMPLPLDEEIEKYQAYIKNQYSFFNYGVWGLYLKEDNQLIGLCGYEMKESANEIRPELGYFIEKDHRKQGYAKEAASYLINHGFQNLGFQEIAVVADIRNLPSINLAHKLGMKEQFKMNRDGKELTLFLRSDLR